MCQVEEDYNGLECNQEKIPVPTLNRKCMKCKEGTAVLIIRVNDAFCRSCFKEYFIHKFRAMLGKNRVIFPQEKVLLAVSGGAASCSMLSQVQEGLSREAPKKFRFVPGIIYIDDGGACGRSAEERQRSNALLKSIFTETGFTYFIVSLEQVFSLPTSVLVPGTSDPDPSNPSYKQAVDQYIKEKQTLTEENVASAVAQLSIADSAYSPERKLALERLFSSMKTLTAKEDMLQTLRSVFSKLLYSFCFYFLSFLRYKIIFKPYTVQIRLLSVWDVAFNDETFFTHDKASIQRLTESFVTNLQSDFPSTVSTIYRTSEKLHTVMPPQSQTAEPASKCLLCHCTLDTKVGRLYLISLFFHFSELYFRLPSHQDLKMLLCYSCRLTIKDMVSLRKAPHSWVQSLRVLHSSNSFYDVVDDMASQQFHM
uniref:Cytoplasmic tRNA 2-thiolation protein 2 n=1 Tax=Sinocyclocheilus grahami TaxID=75366 RepID=A0A672MDE7_SINGR